ncbi:MAG: hypothetical protein IJV01_06975 [Bacteroidales bacterium]|nr:hypothetical protein [Bacteroidales bacterium]
MPDALFEKGSFFTGVNYWGSESATEMWNRWNPQSIDLDIRTLAQNGVQVIRCFPRWDLFQPITMFYGIRGSFMEYGMNGGPLTDPDGVDMEMIGRFRFLCDCCSKYGVKVIPSIITGWMSSRLFVPEPLQRVNVISNSEAIMWEVRFVRRFVRELKDHPAIAAWDLGNECNCMGGVENPHQAWQWLYSISSAIRLEDPGRPVISGMHGQSTGVWDKWNLQTQGELLDILTPHPYPGFRPEANREPGNGLRNANHVSAQCLMYEGIAGKPAFGEECGSMGPNIMSHERAAKMLTMQYFQSWADGLSGHLYWCAYDQSHLDFPPYSWNMMERELGMTTRDHKPLPELEAMKRFNEFRRSLPFSKLPPRQIDAYVILPETKDAWPMPIAALCLARQAGFDIAFTGAAHPLPDASFYILPSSEGWNVFPMSMWTELKKRIAENGATLLYTRGGGMAGLSEFEDVFGVRIEANYREARVSEFAFEDRPAETLKTRDSAVSLWRPTTAKVLAKDKTGNPMVTLNTFGKGKAIAVNAPVEYGAVDQAGIFTWEVRNPLYRIYERAAAESRVVRRVMRDNPGVTFTEHPQPDGTTLVVGINCLEENVACPISVHGKVGQVWGARILNGVLQLEANCGCIFEVR